VEDEYRQPPQEAHMAAMFKILVVEDLDILRTTVVYSIHQLFTGINVIPDIDEASNGEDAFTKISREHFHLIISDWKMPIMDGIGLAEKTQKFCMENETPKPFFLLMSVDDINECPPGVDRFVLKDNLRSELEDIILPLLKVVTQ